MASSNIVILAIVVTSLATYISRFLGAVTSEKINVKSKIFQWFNCVAYSTLAALLGRMIIFPAGALSDSNYLSRFIVVLVAIIIFKLTRNNLVYPTLFAE